jgi:hypothetical protein
MPRYEYDRWQSDLENQRRAEEERRAHEAREAEERRAREAREAEERRARDAREAEERAERARRDREAGERRQAELRKFSDDRDRCRQFRIVAACDAALESPHATYHDRTDLNGWRESGVKFADNLAACRNHDVGACDAALAFQAVPEQTRTLLLGWRADAPLQRRALASARRVWDASLSWARDRVAMVIDLPASTVIASGIALTLAVILGAVLTVGRSRLRSFPAATMPPEVNPPAKDGPAEPWFAASTGQPDAPIVQQPGAGPTEPRSSQMTLSESLSHAPSEHTATRSGRLRPTVIGASIHGTYSTSRGIASFIGFIGWLFVGVGALAVIGGLQAGPFGLMIIGIAIGVAAAGVLQVAAAQMLRASVDSADYARQALLLQIGMAEERSEIDLRRA